MHMCFSGFQPTETSRSLSRFDIASAAFSFRWPHLLFLSVSLSICMGVALLPATGQSASPVAEINDTAPVVHALCGKAAEARVSGAPVRSCSNWSRSTLEQYAKSCSADGETGGEASPLDASESRNEIKCRLIGSPLLRSVRLLAFLTDLTG